MPRFSLVSNHPCILLAVRKNTSLRPITAAEEALKVCKNVKSLKFGILLDSAALGASKLQWEIQSKTCCVI